MLCACAFVSPNLIRVSRFTSKIIFYVLKSRFSLAHLVVSGGTRFCDQAALRSGLFGVLTEMQGGEMSGWLLLVPDPYMSDEIFGVRS